MQTHSRAYGAHITAEEWTVIQERYKRGVNRETLMREHKFSRSAWRQYLQSFMSDHELAKMRIGQRMEDLYRSKPSTPIHIVVTILGLEPSIVEDLWPIVRRNVLRERAMQTAIRDLAKEHACSKNIRETLSRSFGYRDWDKMRKSIVWHKDIYREIVEIISNSKGAQDIAEPPRQTPYFAASHPDILPPRSVVVEDIVGQELNVEYLRRGSEIVWRFTKNTQVYYYCTEKRWSQSSAYRRIQETQKNAVDSARFSIDK